MKTNMADSEQPSSGVNIVSKMDDDATNGDPPAPRENMIATAIRFLQNPKVRESPFSQRKTFLAKKGLTEKEIEIAIERSGTAGDATAVVPVAQVNQGAVPVAQSPVQVVSPWSRWRDYTATALVVGGVSYGLYYVVKKYLMPMWVGPSEEQKRTAALQASVKELETSLQAVVANLQEMQKSMKKQQETLQQVVINSSASRGPMEMEKMQQHQYVSEIKGEIQSLKGLLLSRKQFPPTPKTTPVIPAWQLGAGNNSTSTGSSGESEVKDETTVTSDIQPLTSSQVINGDVSMEKDDISCCDQSQDTSCCKTERSLAGTSSQGVFSEGEQNPEAEQAVETRSSVAEDDMRDSHGRSEATEVTKTEDPMTTES